MLSHVILTLLSLFLHAFPDETLRRYGAADRIWELTTLNGEAFEAEATITFPERNRVAGLGPCNRYFSTNTTPYPWFEIGPIASTRRSCPDIKAEQAFFEALRAAQTAIIEGETLTFSTDDAPSLVFTARD